LIIQTDYDYSNRAFNKNHDVISDSHSVITLLSNQKTPPHFFHFAPSLTIKISSYASVEPHFEF